MKNRFLRILPIAVLLFLLMAGYQNCIGPDSDDGAVQGTDVGNPMIARNPSKTISGVTVFAVNGVNSQIAASDTQEQVEQIFGADIDLSIDEDKTEEFYGHIFTNPEMDSDPSGITYHPNATAICGESIFAINCRRFFNNISVFQTGGANEGTISFRFRGIEVLRLVYSPTLLESTIHIGQLRNFIDAAIRDVEGRTPQPHEVPEKSEGRISISLEQLDDHRGRIKAGVIEALALKGVADEGHNFDLSVARSEDLLVVEFDELEETGFVSLDLQESTIVHTFDDDASKRRTGKIEIDQLGGTFAANNKDGTLNLSDFGTGNNGLRFSVSQDPDDVDSELIEFSSVALLPFSVSGIFGILPRAQIEFLSAFDLDINYSLATGLSDSAGSLNVDLPFGTILGQREVSDGEPDPPIHVENGQFNALGTGATAGQLNLVAGQCLAGQDTDFPFIEIACP